MNTVNKKVRMHWLDGARLAAAFCIIGIHSSSDRVGQAFADALPGDRVFAVMLRTVSEMASTEYFILVSLFLLAVRMNRNCLLYTSPSPRDGLLSRMPSSA